MNHYTKAGSNISGGLKNPHDLGGYPRGRQKRSERSKEPFFTCGAIRPITLSFHYDELELFLAES
jgi:hypothetical protein